MAKDPRLERAGVSGYNKPKRTPNHPTKSHVVVAKEGDKVKEKDVLAKNEHNKTVIRTKETGKVTKITND